MSRRRRPSPAAEASRRALRRALPAMEIDAELEALPEGVELTATISALNQWQRQRPPKGRRRLVGLRRWLLDEALKSRRDNPKVTYKALQADLVARLEEDDYDDAVPKHEALAAWDEDRDKLLANDAKPLLEFLKHNLKERQKNGT